LEQQISSWELQIIPVRGNTAESEARNKHPSNASIYVCRASQLSAAPQGWPAGDYTAGGLLQFLLHLPMPACTFMMVWHVACGLVVFHGLLCCILVHFKPVRIRMGACLLQSS
jgi:hypothetical protein